MSDWGGLRTIIDGQPIPRERVDCPVCGEVLEVRDGIWNCPRWGAAHYREMRAPIS